MTLKWQHFNAYKITFEEKAPVVDFFFFFKQNPIQKSTITMFFLALAQCCCWCFHNNYLLLRITTATNFPCACKLAPLTYSIWPVAGSSSTDIVSTTVGNPSFPEPQFLSAVAKTGNC